MRQIDYAMRFTGHATLVGPDGNVLRASTSSPYTAITSLVGGSGLTRDLETAPGGEATFTSQVTFDSETNSLETGTIEFGDGHSLRFTTVGSGYLTQSAEPGRKQGALTWRVDGGPGQFAVATG